jgi:hypothetical protein
MAESDLTTRFGIFRDRAADADLQLGSLRLEGIGLAPLVRTLLTAESYQDGPKLCL